MSHFALREAVGFTYRPFVQRFAFNSAALSRPFLIGQGYMVSSFMRVGKEHFRPRAHRSLTPAQALLRLAVLSQLTQPKLGPNLWVSARYLLQLE